MAKLKLRGRVVHMPGYWGDELPVAGAKVRIVDVDQPGKGDDVIWSGTTGGSGEFQGTSKEWQDSLTLRFPSRIRIPDPTDVLMLQAHITHAGRETRLPFTYVSDREISPDLVVPWGPPRQRLVQIRPLNGRSNLREMKKADLEALVRTPGTRVMTPGSVQASLKNSLRAREETRKAFQKLFASRPDLIKRYERWGPSKDFDAPKLTFKDNNGKKRTVALLHPDSLIRDLVLSRRLLQDATHQANTYELMYELTAQSIERAAADGDYWKQKLASLPRPADLAGKAVKTIDGAISDLAHLAVSLFGLLQGGGGQNDAPGDCKDEEGAGFGGDMTPSPGATANPTGLLANNTWPLKPFTTCVRDQGNRGTCTAFGITAAVESAAAVKYQRWLNLSEQDLYMEQKLHWFPVPWDWYGDGYNAAYSVLLQMLGGVHTFPFERDWDYNQSRSRQKDDQQRTYSDSCDGYNGEACSDTNHQAALVCRRIDTTVVEEVVEEVCTWVENAASSVPLIGGWIEEAVGDYVCEPVTKLVETVEQVEVCTYETVIPGTSGLRITGATLIWDPLSAFNSDIALAKAFLAARMPVIFCFDVAGSFDDHDGGYVTYDASEEDSRGGHCALLTGFVDNSDLPVGAPPGAGGGYFVLKNSWGVDSGDLGYWYLPYAWVNKWGTAMIALTSIAP